MKRAIQIALLIVPMIMMVSCSRVKTVWTVDQFVANPESVYYDAGSKQLFVSNVDGEGDKKDGKGFISKLKTTGEFISKKWVSGLNAPKGMRSINGVLWVTDIDQLVAIDISSGTILSKITIPTAKFLNDIAITPEQILYVSDTIGGAIYEVKHNNVSVFMKGEELESPNGLLYKDGKLYVAAWGKGLAKDWSTKTPGNLYVIDVASKKIKVLTKFPLGNLDGLELDAKGNFLTSDWVAGKIYRILKDGEAKLILEGKKGIADLGFVPSENLIIYPQMLLNKVVAVKE